MKRKLQLSRARRRPLLPSLDSEPPSGVVTGLEPRASARVAAPRHERGLRHYLSSEWGRGIVDARGQRGGWWMRRLVGTKRRRNDDEAQRQRENDKSPDTT